MFHGVRLTLAGIFAVLAILGVALASNILTTDDAAAKPAICGTAATSGMTSAELAALGCGNEAGEDIVNSRATNILRTLVWFGCAVALTFVIVGGIKLATSEGDQAKVAKARNTIVFAAIGLVIALLATFIVDEVVALFM
ncbi:hypothetical protein FWG86_01425 [Candidatus Saccharibacteria bacterium]|nr:hypothetical protein [Candidatus Saccharibacteria bacterium]